MRKTIGILVVLAFIGWGIGLGGGNKRPSSPQPKSSATQSVAPAASRQAPSTTPPRRAATSGATLNAAAKKTPAHTAAAAAANNKRPGATMKKSDDGASAAVTALAAVGIGILLYDMFGGSSQPAAKSYQEQDDYDWNRRYQEERNRNNREPEYRPQPVEHNPPYSVNYWGN